MERRRSGKALVRGFDGNPLVVVLLFHFIAFLFHF